MLGDPKKGFLRRVGKANHNVFLGEGNTFPQPSFWAPLQDAGSGAVTTTLSRGTGSATFTRVTTAWTKLSSGLWASVGTGVARSTYVGLNTAVGVYGGYYCEAAGTQLVTPTASIRDMTNAAWIKVTMTTAKTATGIDGSANSASTITATGALSTILQTLVAAASSRTYSCWMRRKTGTGTILIMQGGTTLDVTALINSSTYTLVQLNASILNSAFGIQINTSGDALEIDFNQFEAGTFATSPMDAAGAVRNADILNYPSANNVAAPAYTSYAESWSEAPAAQISAQCLVTTSAVGYGVGNGSLNKQTSSTTMDAGGNGTSATATYTLIAGGINKFAASFNTTGTLQAGCGNGGTVASNGTLDWTGVGMTAINIGVLSSAASQPHFGGIQNVRLWPSQLANYNLIILTH